MDKPLETEHKKALVKRLETFADLMETRWRIPGTNIPVGLDFLLGLFPVVGDVFTGLLSCWLVWKARALHLPKRIYVRMIINIMIDVVVGSVPVLGDVFDLAYRANTRNVRLLVKYLKQGA